jgi:hypothetical protein
MKKISRQNAISMKKIYESMECERFIVLYDPLFETYSVVSDGEKRDNRKIVVDTENELPIELLGFLNETKVPC